MNLDLSWLTGQNFHGLAQDTEWSWMLDLGAASIHLHCPWRIVGVEGIAVTSADHGKRFGLPEPVDAGVRAAGLLGNRKAVRAEIGEITGDLRIHFEDGLRFEAWNASSGYEGWSLSGPDGYHVIAQGGGQLAVWKAPER